MSRKVTALGILLALLAACAGPEEPTSSASTPAPSASAPASAASLPRDGTIWIPHPEAKTRLFARLCRPAGDGPTPLAVVNHGSPPNAAARPTMAPTACNHETVQWFLARGFAVALPMRQGYGQTGGPWLESYGPCSDSDFAQAGLQSAADISAAIRFLLDQGLGAPGKVLVVGQSAGGWAALALSSQNPPEVGAYVNFAGGRGGWANNRPHNNCSPDNLARDAGVYGRTARGPTLWVYAENDTYFAPELVRRMKEAFAGAGGRAELHQLGPYGADGHSLFFGRGGSRIWGPPVEKFLKETGAIK
jgi:dienelactone hydrolase